jgi:hypothetical protein
MMKIARNLGLGTLFMLLVFSGYSVAGYMGGGSAWRSYEAPAAKSSQMMLSPSSAFIGKLAAINLDRQEVLVDTFIPGLMGPSERIVPFKIGKDTTISICFNSTQTCESGLVGNSGLESLSMVDEQLSDATKNAVVVGDPDNSGRVVHVQVTYEG